MAEPCLHGRPQGHLSDEWPTDRNYGVGEISITDQRHRELTECVWSPLAPLEGMKNLLRAVKMSGTEICMKYPVDTTPLINPQAG